MVEGGWYDGRETDAWAVGVVIYALVCRALPFGEGVPVSGGDGGRIERMSEVRGRERERKSWLMRIAKGDYEWPSSPPATQAANGELRGTQLAHLPRVRKVVDRLLVRNSKKRATLREVRGDEWFGGWVDSAEGRVVERGSIGDVAWREVE